MSDSQPTAMDPCSPGRNVQACILSGGRALRAGGVNKSLMTVQGKPIIEHQLQVLRPIFGERITVVTDRPEDYAPLGLSTIGDLEIEGAADGRGALRGIASALAAFPRHWLFLIASDMPWPDAGILSAQCSALDAEGGRADFALRGVCIECPGGAEPFHGLYHGSLGASAARAWLSEEKSVRRWIRSHREIRTMSAEDLGVSAEALRRCLTNFNSPGES